MGFGLKIINFSVTFPEVSCLGFWLVGFGFLFGVLWVFCFSEATSLVFVLMWFLLFPAVPFQGLLRKVSTGQTDVSSDTRLRVLQGLFRI